MSLNFTVYFCECRTFPWTFPSWIFPRTYFPRPENFPPHVGQGHMSRLMQQVRDHVFDEKVESWSKACCKPARTCRKAGQKLVENHGFRPGLQLAGIMECGPYWFCFARRFCLTENACGVVRCGALWCKPCVRRATAFRTELHSVKVRLR